MWLYRHRGLYFVVIIHYAHLFSIVDFNVYESTTVYIYIHRAQPVFLVKIL